MAILWTRNFSFAPIAKFHTLSSVVAAIPYQRVCEFVVYIAECADSCLLDVFRMMKMISVSYM
jgi:hypothetical protein